MEVDQSMQDDENISKKGVQCSIEDLKLEYKLKYEGLLKIYHEMVKAFANASKSSEVFEDGYHNYLNELKKDGLEKDMQIYKLQEEVTDLKSKFAELQSKYSTPEEQTIKVDGAHGPVANETLESQNQSSSMYGAPNGHVASGTLESQNQSSSMYGAPDGPVASGTLESQNQSSSMYGAPNGHVTNETLESQNQSSSVYRAADGPVASGTLESQNQSSSVHKSDNDLSVFKEKARVPVDESPIVVTSLPKTDIASPLFLPETPRQVSRVRRMSIMNETIDKATPTNAGERGTFFKRIIMEQKELLDFYATITGFMAWKERAHNDAESQEYLVDFFKMKPQNNKLKDMEIQFLVDYGEDDIEYRPINLPQEEDPLQKIAPYLKDTLYLSSENAPKLLKTLLDAIES
eukprot:Seg2104.5 transcript_id=Seg2104.5/GoldUCD/mRNA.D3Y31 product="hypothetical protein" protein_id=Seg2104.5/GoldUCD/D3Y31